MSHALLSPSGASRWLACTPSARLEETFASTTNSAAEEGTLAHALSELYLRSHLKLISTVNFKAELRRLKANALYNSEMDGYCVDYVDFITEKLNELKSPSIFIEEKIDLTAYVPDGFGTADCVMIADHILDLNDLKYGKGVLVEAHENKQMMLYALGALKKFSLLYEIGLVRMTIYQPRLGNYSSYEIEAEELILWGDTYVKPKAQMAYNGEGEYCAGGHCKFCKAKTTCKALADYNMELAKYVFEDPNKLTDEDISAILEKAADFKTWLANIQEYALAEATLRQKKWPGFKLVAGRSNCVYANPTAIMETLQKTKLDKSLYLTEPKLLGIGALEKNIGKSEVDKLVGSYIIKPAGAATLVPEWDKRPELNSSESAALAFENIQI